MSVSRRQFFALGAGAAAAAVLPKGDAVLSGLDVAAGPDKTAVVNMLPMSGRAILARQHVMSQEMRAKVQCAFNIYRSQAIEDMQFLQGEEWKLHEGALSPALRRS